MKHNITESEWAVMEVLWRTPGLTLAQIVEALQGRGWQYTTIRTLVARLCDKGFLRAEKCGRGFRYSAAPDATADACRVEEAQGFLDRVYRGSVTAMVSGLARQGRVSRAELDALRAAIDALEDEP